MEDTKMFCKMCFDSGKTEEEYTSHWVKDAPNGKVVCPTLLANECGYCHKKGHTPKFCPRLASRDARREARKGHRHCGGGCTVRPTLAAFAVGAQEKMRQHHKQAQAQKRARARCSDNQYAELMGTREIKRVKVRRTKAAPVWNGPKVAVPRAPQGAWGKTAQVMQTVKDMTVHEVNELKTLLSQMNICNFGAPSITDEEQAWLDAQLAKTSQTEEETADGEAFFDNVEDAADAAVEIASVEAPPLQRQGAFADPHEDLSQMPLPTAADHLRDDHGKSNGIALPAECDMDKDLEGSVGGDGWGDEVMQQVAFPMDDTFA